MTPSDSNRDDETAGPASEDKPATAQIAPVAAIPSLAYYAPNPHVPPHIARAVSLFGHATGPVGQWPVSESDAEALRETAELRRIIRGLASWLHFCAAIAAITTAINVLPAVIDLVSHWSSTMFRHMWAPWAWISPGRGAAIAALYYATYRSTYRCRIWAPTVMLALHALVGMYYLGCCVSLAAAERDPELSFPAMTFSFDLMVSAVCAGICFCCLRAMKAIPQFLARPMWTVALMGDCDR